MEPWFGTTQAGGVTPLNELGEGLAQGLGRDANALDADLKDLKDKKWPRSGAGDQTKTSSPSTENALGVVRVASGFEELYRRSTATPGNTLSLQARLGVCLDGKLGTMAWTLLAFSQPSGKRQVTGLLHNSSQTLTQTLSHIVARALPPHQCLFALTPGRDDGDISSNRLCHEPCCCLAEKSICPHRAKCMWLCGSCWQHMATRWAASPLLGTRWVSSASAGAAEC